MGMAHLEKAARFDEVRNWIQALRHADLALTKLKQIKDRRLGTVEILDNAFRFKFDALQRLDRRGKLWSASKSATLCGPCITYDIRGRSKLLLH